MEHHSEDALHAPTAHNPTQLSASPRASTGPMLAITGPTTVSDSMEHHSEDALNAPAAHNTTQTSASPRARTSPMLVNTGPTTVCNHSYLAIVLTET